MEQQPYQEVLVVLHGGFIYGGVSTKTATSWLATCAEMEPDAVPLSAWFTASRTLTRVPAARPISAHTAVIAAEAASEFTSTTATLPPYEPPGASE